MGFGLESGGARGVLVLGAKGAELGEGDAVGCCEGDAVGFDEVEGEGDGAASDELAGGFGGKASEEEAGDAGEVGWTYSSAVGMLDRWLN